TRLARQHAAHPDFAITVDAGIEADVAVPRTLHHEGITGPGADEKREGGNIKRGEKRHAETESGGRIQRVTTSTIAHARLNWHIAHPSSDTGHGNGAPPHYWQQELFVLVLSSLDRPQG